VQLALREADLVRRTPDVRKPERTGGVVAKLRQFHSVQFAVGHSRHPGRRGVRVGDWQIVLRIERHRMVAFVNFNLTRHKANQNAQHHCHRKNHRWRVTDRSRNKKRSGIHQMESKSQFTSAPTDQHQHQHELIRLISISIFHESTFASQLIASTAMAPHCGARC
jgi:hypothetical protein